MDGTNYPLWAYMMRHVLIAKGLWNIVKGNDTRTGSTNTGTVEDAASFDSDAAPAPQVLPPPTIDQTRWDGRDAQAHALIALSIKCTIIPHIQSCKSAKDAWNTLARLYQVRNEAPVASLRKQLESEHMNEGDSMDNFLTKIKDLKEQLIVADEILPDSSIDMSSST